jgi:hypothetical protein
MFELLFCGLVIFMGGMLILKVLFFLLGLIFAGLGFFIKILLAAVCCILLFPVGVLVLGTVFSGGFLVFVLGAVGLAALMSEKKPEL